MQLRESSLGRFSFVARHGLWGDGQAEAAERVTKLIEEERIEVVRLSFGDQHGILRGKAVTAQAFPIAMRNGYTITNTLLAKDTSHRTVYPVFTAGGGFGMPEMEGAGDIVLVPDPTTFRLLPWAPGTGWVLCDIYFPNGKPVPFSTRHIYRKVLDDLARQGYEYVAGLEVEFYVLKLEDPKLRPEQAGQPPEPPDVRLLAHGFQYLTENRMDELDSVLQILRRNLTEVGLPLRSIEAEFGPSQCEMTFDPGIGLEPADNMLLFRSLVKQVCRRHGYHATFMCRPGLPNLFSSGWHLHQSLRDRTSGRNAFTPSREAEALTPLGRHFVGGLLAHARAASVFTTPTINGYKRYKPYTLAPDRVTWGRDNKGAMIRVVGGPDDPGTRLENRVGEPAANPYLYMASQIITGMDGVEKGRDPGEPTDEPYAARATPLPQSLTEALAALREDTLFREKMGDTFIDYIITLKEFEINRFLSEVTDWEHREYFEMF
jgi:glutamine synthetase